MHRYKTPQKCPPPRWRKVLWPCSLPSDQVFNFTRLKSVGRCRLASQFFIVKSVRLIRGNTEPGFALLFVGLEIAFAPVDVAVARKGGSVSITRAACRIRRARRSKTSYALALVQRQSKVVVADA